MDLFCVNPEGALTMSTSPIDVETNGDCNCNAGVDTKKFTFSFGAALIAIERQRQVNFEGYDHLHDLEHGNFELLQAAVHYAASCFPTPESEGVQIMDFEDNRYLAAEACLFPWVDSKVDNHNMQRRLVIAGALIAAQLDLIAEELDSNFDPDQLTSFPMESAAAASVEPVREKPMLAEDQKDSGLVRNGPFMAPPSDMKCPFIDCSGAGPSHDIKEDKDIIFRCTNCGRAFGNSGNARGVE